MGTSPIRIVRDSRYVSDRGIRWYGASVIPIAYGSTQQAYQCREHAEMHVRLRLNANRSAFRAVKHPHRKFQAPISRVALTATPAEIARRSLHHFMDVDDASAPRMKRIKHLSPLGPVGVLSLPCTTAVVLTPRLTGARPIKLTMPRCPSVWQHNARSAGQLAS